MKILHITGYAIRGGCEKNCYHFIREASEHQHVVVVMGEEGPMSQEWQSAGAEVVHLHLISKNILQFSSGLTGYLSGKHFDIAISWTTIRLPLQLKSASTVSPSIKVYLGNPVGKNYKPLKDNLLTVLLQPQINTELLACSSYVSTSYKESSYYSRFGVRVSLNPVEIPTEPATLEKKSNTIGMVARLDPIKDHKTVIQAMKGVKEKLPGLKLHLLGDGSLRPSLEQLAKDLGVGDQVMFHGDVKDVYAHLRTWDAFVYATTSEEGLGSSVAEAMAMGLPCLLSDLPMLRELAPEDQALWFKAHDSNDLATKLIQLVNDDTLRHSLGIKARQHALSHFTPRRFVNDYLT